MNVNFAKISLQQKQRSFEGFFDPTSKEQDERAVTALAGINLRAKKASRRLHVYFLSALCFISFSSALMGPNVVFLLACLTEMSLLKREKLSNLLKKIYNTLD